MATTKWKIDPMHSEINFRVKHMVVSKVTGKFTEFSGTMETEDDNLDTAKINFEANVKSITTHQEDRDKHLKSDDFFNAEAFPHIKFESTDVEKKGEDTYQLKGNLTIRDQTRPVSLHVEHGGIAEDMYGRTIAGFELDGTISRKEFGLKWNGITEAGKVVVSDEVKLMINVEVVKE